MKTADELAAEGEERLKRGCVVIFLYPSQEWMAIKMQCPFMRYPKISVDDKRTAHTIPPRT